MLDYLLLSSGLLNSSSFEIKIFPKSENSKVGFDLLKVRVFLNSSSCEMLFCLKVDEIFDFCGGRTGSDFYGF